jgi:hypothetical protein
VANIGGTPEGDFQVPGALNENPGKSGTIEGTWFQDYGETNEFRGFVTSTRKGVATELAVAPTGIRTCLPE